VQKTILVKHSTDYTDLLSKARRVAEWAVANKYQISSKFVKHIGLPSAISNQVLRKYGMNDKVRDVKSVKLTIPRNKDGIRITDDHTIQVGCLKISFKCWYDLSDVSKINQIEVDNKYYYITFDVPEENQYEANGFIGIDLNATGHSAVIAIGAKILKRGKQAPPIKKTTKDT